MIKQVQNSLIATIPATLSNIGGKIISDIKNGIFSFKHWLGNKSYKILIVKQLCVYFYNFLPLKKMLNSSINPIRSTKINECIMRRRARNLRAKVKALLPVQTCCKHDQRNRCVHQIQNNANCWNNLDNNNEGWTISKQKQNKYYFENPPVINQHERFQKLTQAEIEQIKEDRLYYLGEENLPDFQEFLQRKTTSHHQLDQFSQQIIIKTYQQLLHPKNPLLSAIFRKNTQQFQPEALEFLSLSPCLSKRSPRKQNTQEKAKNFEHRRKIILLQEKSKILMDKVKMNMRLEKAENKLKELNGKKEFDLETRREQKQLKMKRVTSKRRNYQNRGQIKQLQQKLRKTFLNRMSKTTCEFSRVKKNDVQKFQ